MVDGIAPQEASRRLQICQVPLPINLTRFFKLNVGCMKRSTKVNIQHAVCGKLKTVLTDYLRYPKVLSNSFMQVY